MGMDAEGSGAEDRSGGRGQGRAVSGSGTGKGTDNGKGKEVAGNEDEGEVSDAARARVSHTPIACTYGLYGCMMTRLYVCCVDSGSRKEIRPTKRGTHETAGGRERESKRKRERERERERERARERLVSLHSGPQERGGPQERPCSANY
eukprot:Tamp_26662.p1 GENE.Tamp_26662~~Tamp_26662.p1  ORF type:complete len:149 (-),score=17.90 Tamp_26662:68-514(-)